MRLIFALITLVLTLPAAAAAGSFCAPAVLSGMEIREQTHGFNIDVKYPALCSPTASQTIRDAVTNALNDFKKEEPDFGLRDFPHKYEMLTDYSVWTAGKGRLASVKIHTMIYTGGAHPNNWPETWVFDMTDGHPLTLKDVFTDVTAALNEAAGITRELIPQALGEMNVESMLMDGTAPTDANYDDFILTEDGVAFFFAPYQIAPYAAGEQVVTVPYERLESLLTQRIRDVLGR